MLDNWLSLFPTTAASVLKSNAQDAKLFLSQYIDLTCFHPFRSNDNFQQKTFYFATSECQFNEYSFREPETRTHGILHVIHQHLPLCRVLNGGIHCHPELHSWQNKTHLILIYQMLTIYQREVQRKVKSLQLEDLWSSSWSPSNRASKLSLNKNVKT